MIYVFKTSIKTKKDTRKLRPHLNVLLQQAKWNVDLDDCDKILRIESMTVTAAAVIKLLRCKGFDCDELMD